MDRRTDGCRRSKRDSPDTDATTPLLSSAVTAAAVVATDDHGGDLPTNFFVSVLRVETKVDDDVEARITRQDIEGNGECMPDSGPNARAILFGRNVGASVASTWDRPRHGYLTDDSLNDDVQLGNVDGRREFHGQCPSRSLYESASWPDAVVDFKAV